MDKVIRIVVLVLLIAMLAGCAPGGNELANAPDKNGIVAGFWRGLWNGAISPVTFIISLFNRSVQIYEVHNNGAWYNLGFLLGASIIFGGSVGGGARARRSRN